MSFQEYENNRQLSREREPRPKVTVRFHGYMHDDLNLQAISNIRAVLGDHLETSVGRNIVYMESSRMEHSITSGLKKMISDRGFTRVQAVGILRSQLGRFPTEREIEDRIGAITSSDIDRIVSGRLIPSGEIHNYFIFQVFDDLKKQHDFEFDLESHSRPVTQAIIALGDEATARELGAFRSFKAGNFHDMLDSYRKSHQKMYELTRLREEDMVEHLRDRIRPLVKGAGGSVFAIQGATHLPMSDMLQRRIGNHIPVRIVSNEVPSLALTTTTLSGSFRRGGQPTDEMVAQEFFYRFLATQLAIYATDTHQLTNYTSNYEPAMDTLATIALNLSFVEIQRFCEVKQDGLEFLRNHPAADALLPFITL